MLYKGSVQNCLPFLDDLFSLSIVDILRGQESDSGMVMFSIVPEEEILTEEPGILDTAEPLRKLRPVFHGFELGFRIGIVITYMGS